MKSGRVLLADCHLNILESVHGLLETVFETVFMVADERSLIEAVATFAPISSSWICRCRWRKERTLRGSCTAVTPLSGSSS